MIIIIMYMDDKLFAKNGKELETNTHSENIQLVYRDGIWHRKRRHTNKESGKQHMTNRMELPN